MSEPIPLWKSFQEENATLAPYRLPGKELRPAILVIPGGGYGCVCEWTEGQPVARYFNGLGFHAFVLNYRVAPHRFPEPQQDALRAMRMIRHFSKEWNVIPDKVVVCGFSAGAHLAGSIGTISASIPNVEHDEIDSENGVPDAMILSYGVLCFEPWTHMGSVYNLLGDTPDPELLKLCSLEKNVDEKTAPAFIWHTLTDQLVPFENSVRFAQAMAAKKRPCELHLFPYGNHGMLLGLDTPDLSQWPGMAKAFLETQWKMRDDPSSMQYRYTNEHQGGMEHPE